jgi:hypothetical protein
MVPPRSIKVKVAVGLIFTMRNKVKVPAGGPSSNTEEIEMMKYSWGLQKNKNNNIFAT